MRLLGLHAVLGWLALCAPPAAAQPQMLCGVYPQSQHYWCVRYRDMAADLDGVRVAPVFQGGPRLVLPTHYVARADCGRGVLSLTTGGAVVWAARFDESSLGLAELGTAMCEVGLP